MQQACKASFDGHRHCAPSLVCSLFASICALWVFLQLVFGSHFPSFHFSQTAARAGDSDPTKLVDPQALPNHICEHALPCPCLAQVECCH